MRKVLTLLTILSFLCVTQMQEAEIKPLRNFDEVGVVIERVLSNHHSLEDVWRLTRSRSIVEYEIRNHPESALAWYRLGFIRFHVDRDKAEEAFKKAIELKPDFAEAYQGLGIYYQFPGLCGNLYFEWSNGERVRSYEKAIRAHISAIELKPDFPEAYTALGEVLFKVKNYKDSINAYQRAIELNAGRPENYLGLSKALEMAGRYEEAIDAANKYIQVFSDFIANHPKAGSGEIFYNPSLYEPYNRVGNLYRQIGKHDEALRTFKKMVELKLANSGTHLQLGLTYVALGDFASAREQHSILVRMSLEKEEGFQNAYIKKEADHLFEQIRHR